MKWNNFENFLRQNKEGLDRPFDHQDDVWARIQGELASSADKLPKPRILWWKPLSGVAAAVVLGLLAVWGLQEYRELTVWSPEMAASVHFYENTEFRLIKTMNDQDLIISPDISYDLQEIEQSQKILKKALHQAPENKKKWVYNALIETYELKIQLLEKIIYYDHLEQRKINKDGTSL